MKLVLTSEEIQSGIEVQLNTYHNRTMELNNLVIQAEVRKIKYVNWTSLTYVFNKNSHFYLSFSSLGLTWSKDDLK